MWWRIEVVNSESVFTKVDSQGYKAWLKQTKSKTKNLMINTRAVSKVQWVKLISDNRIFRFNKYYKNWELNLFSKKSKSKTVRNLEILDNIEDRCFYFLRSFKKSWSWKIGKITTVIILRKGTRATVHRSLGNLIGFELFCLCFYIFFQFSALQGFVNFRLWAESCVLWEQGLFFR